VPHTKEYMVKPREKEYRPWIENTLFGWKNWVDSNMKNRKIKMPTKYSRASEIIEKHEK
jgi:hypothetical protein